jgi:hypothetical protein
MTKTPYTPKTPDGYRFCNYDEAIISRVNEDRFGLYWDGNRWCTGYWKDGEGDTIFWMCAATTTSSWQPISTAPKDRPILVKGRISRTVGNHMVKWVNSDKNSGSGWRQADGGWAVEDVEYWFDVPEAP